MIPFPSNFQHKVPSLPTRPMTWACDCWFYIKVFWLLLKQIYTYNTQNGFDRVVQTIVLQFLYTTGPSLLGYLLAALILTLAAPRVWVSYNRATGVIQFRLFWFVWRLPVKWLPYLFKLISLQQKRLKSLVPYCHTTVRILTKQLKREQSSDCTAGTLCGLYTGMFDPGHQTVKGSSLRRPSCCAKHSVSITKYTRTHTNNVNA